MGPRSRTPPGRPRSGAYWAIGIVEARAVGDVDGLSLLGIELLDAEEHVVGGGARELELRTVPPDRSTRDFSESGTAPFEGRLRAGEVLRLWMRARMDDGLDSSRRPVRFRARFRYGAARRAELEGALDFEWPTG